MRCFKINRSRAVVIQCAFPACHADAPFVAWLQSGETPFRMWRDKVISIEHREIEKFPCYFHADRMKPDILRSGAAKTVPVKSGDWFATTTFQLSSQNIRRHKRCSCSVEPYGDGKTTLNRTGAQKNRD